MSRFIKKDDDGFYVFDEREFLKTLPTGLEYFAVDKESKQIYGLGFNYKQKMDKQIADLEAKLAEKEKENERLKELVMHKTYNRNAVEARLNYEQNQLAIEQLEKVKEFVNNFYGEYSASVITNFIDNQINELKGEK